MLVRIGHQRASGIAEVWNNETRAHRKTLEGLSHRLVERQALLRSARRVLGPPGQPIDRLLWLAMRRQFGEHPDAKAHVTPDPDVSRLTIAEGVNIVGKCSVSTQKPAEGFKQDRPSRPDFKKGRDDKMGGERLGPGVSAD